MSGEKNKKSAENKKTSSMVLTPNEEMFVFYLLAGDSRRRAYIKAYPNCKANERVVDVKAYKVFHRDRVRIRYEEGLKELRQRRMQDAVVQGEKAAKELDNIAYGNKKYAHYDGFGKRSEREPTVAQRLKALEILKKGSDELLKIQAAEDAGIGESKLEIVLKVEE